MVWLFATSLQPRERWARCRPELFAAAVLHHAGIEQIFVHAAQLIGLPKVLVIPGGGLEPAATLLVDPKHFTMER